MDTPQIQLHDHWLGTGTSIQSGRINLQTKHHISFWFECFGPNIIGIETQNCKWNTTINLMKIRVVKYLWKGEINLLMINSCVQLSGNKYPKYIFVDTNLLFFRFTNIVCRWPGSVHNSFIFNNSALIQMLETSNACGWLLGDSRLCNGLRQYLMKPKLNPSTQAEEKYNMAHAKTRVVIERAFGVCKSRFR